MTAGMSTGWRNRPVDVCIAVLGLGIALSPTNTKIAGVTWLLVCLAGLAVFFRRPVVENATVPASKVWLIACVLAAVLAIAMTLVWPNGPDTLHAEFRLLLGAAATHQIVRRTHGDASWKRVVLPAVAMACVAAVSKVAATHDRLFLPSNALPWAISVTFFLCVLVPPFLGGVFPATQRKWYGGAVICALGAILMSQSRGAFVVLIWLLWLAATSWQQGHPGFQLRKVAFWGALAAALLASSAWLPSDPLRLGMGWKELVNAEQKGDYNTSLGARIYLWSLAWHSIQESPWVGVGGRERLRRIKAVGDELSETQRAQLAVVRNVGHVHNQYLHAAMDGGLIGLASTLAVLAGLGASAWRLRRFDPVASRQMQGVLFMHATAGLTNVNMAHNYYAIMLSLAVAVILIGAGARSGDAAPAA